MAELKLLYLGGFKNSLDELEPAAFTQDNILGVPAGGLAQAAVNTTLDATTPKGLLAGSFVAMTGSRIIGACNGDAAFPLGVLLNDVAGNAFENTPAVASGKGPYIQGSAEIEVNVYETFKEDGTTAIVYVAGVALYCSINGLFTDELTTGGVVGYVKKVPTAADPFLGVQLVI